MKAQRRSNTGTKIPRQVPLNQAQLSQVQKLIHRNEELKFVVASQNLTAQSSTASVANILVVGQGDSDSSRDGDSLKWFGNIDLALQVVNGQGATGDIYNNVRVVIFQWHPNSVPTSANIFLFGVTAAVDVYSHYNHDQRSQYKILFDKVFTTCGNANAATTPNTNFVTTGVRKFTVSLARAAKTVQYVGGTTVGTNLFYLLLVSDSALATHPQVGLTLKGYYHDV